MTWDQEWRRPATWTIPEVWEREWRPMTGSDHVWAWQGDMAAGPMLFAWPPDADGKPPRRFEGHDQVFFYVLYHFPEMATVILMNYLPVEPVEIIRVAFRSVSESEGAYRNQRQVLMALLPTVVAVAKLVGVIPARALLDEGLARDESNGPTRIIDLTE
jgi:hypothetical protein